MNTKRLQAFELRKTGKTYKEISKELGLAKSTLSFWFKDEPLSLECKKRNIVNIRPLALQNILKYNERRKNNLNTGYEQAVGEASLEFNRFKHDPLFIAGISLYMGAGDVSQETNTIRLASENPHTLLIFMRFCKHYLNINPEKIRFSVAVPSHLSVGEICEKWRNELNLTIEQFYKPQVYSPKSNNKRLLYGIGNIIIGSKLHKVKLMEWVKLGRVLLGQ